MLASLLSIALAGKIGLTTSALAEDSAAEALKKCDALASHPHDPNRFAVGVSDEQFAPGAAIEACEPAVRLNPELARVWFEMGRAYWIGQRDKEAFSAFIEAAKRNYAPAMKYIGDAYQTGRGLPSSQKQDAQTALDWYKKSAAGGFEDGKKAVAETEDKIKKDQAEAESNKFDPSIFQRPDFMTYVYTLSAIPPKEMELFRIYMHGFVMELGGDQILFVDSKCKPLVPSRTAVAVRDSMFAMFAIQPRADMAHGNYQGWLNSAQFNAFTQGQRDAVELVNRYGCQSEVARTLVDNITNFYHAKHVDAIVTALTQYFPWHPESQCAREYEAWKEANPYGAYTAGCMSSDNQPDLETAKREAIAACENDHNRNCQVVAQSIPAKPAQDGTPATTAPTTTQGDWQPTKDCLAKYTRFFEEWRAKPSVGAFAIAQDCIGGGTSYNLQTHEKAREVALSNCSKRGPNCKVIYENPPAIARDATSPTQNGNSAQYATIKKLGANLRQCAEASNVRCPPIEPPSPMPQGFRLKILGAAENGWFEVEARDDASGKTYRGFVNGNVLDF